MTGPSPLERHYRRLLRSYPKSFREQHEHELLAVLLACAEDGRRLPRPAEALDLVAHGLRARLHARTQTRATDTAPPDRDVSWGDALTAASVHGLGPPSSERWTYHRWFRDRRWLAVALVAALLAALGWWAFRDLNDHFFARDAGAASTSVSVGPTTYLGVPVTPFTNLAFGPAVEVNMRSITPRVTTNTAAATVQVMVCTGRFARSLLDGAAAGSPNVCRTLSGFHAGNLRISARTGIVLAVTARYPGVVRVDGVDLHYWRGIRYGHQHVGLTWTLHAS